MMHIVNRLFTNSEVYNPLLMNTILPSPLGRLGSTQNGAKRPAGSQQELRDRATLGTLHKRR